MKKRLLFFLWSILFVSNIHSISDWTFLIYMEGEGDLAPWVLKNLNDMVETKFTMPINIVVQCHVVGNIAFRYLVKDGSLIHDGCVDFCHDNIKDLVDAADWAFNKYKAMHHSIILWNHGFGILDPSYVENNLGQFSFEAEIDLENDVCSDGFCPLKYFDGQRINYVNHKGVLFRDSDKSYLTNQQMVDAFKIIKEDILQNKKLDILGTDCCKMAMLEIGYQIKDFVDYLIGSQNCELLDGWNYKDFFNSFTKYLNTKEVCCSVVDSYGKYYRENTKENIYTLSAFSLNSINLLVNNINDFSNYYLKLLEKEFDYFNKLVKTARLKSLAICQAPFYTDIDSFYSELLIELDSEEKYFSEIENLKNILNDGKEIIKQTVVANVTGENKKEAKGISIYFPHNHIDSSYIKTVFAKETLWLNFLEKIKGG
ncbi:MAG: clostripain-related cysteine peptidase [bacterium]